MLEVKAEHFIERVVFDACGLLVISFLLVLELKQQMSWRDLFKNDRFWILATCCLTFVL